MKVGDLVTLSSYGRKLKMYSNVVDNDVGLIVKETGYAFVLGGSRATTGMHIDIEL